MPLNLSHRMIGRRRGSVLAGAMAVIFMLMVIAMALHYHQSMARQSAMAAEADLRFREGLRFAEAQQVGAGGAPPSGLAITGSVSEDPPPGGVPTIDALYAKNIFDREKGLPDLRALGTAPVHTYLKVKPSTTDLALMIFSNRTYGAVLSQVPGWAAYAPRGSVTIGDLRGFANPTFDDTRKATEAYSGVPAMVGGLKDVSADFVTYGELHTVDGKATIKNGPGVGYKAKQFVIRDYANDLFTQIGAARNALISAASSGDKTNSLVSDSVGPEAILDLFFGGSSGLEKFLSLRNANHFWLPMIPTFCSAPPYYYEFDFSVPYPPDNSSFDQVTVDKIAQDLSDLQGQMPDAAKEFKEAKTALDAAQAAYDADKSDINLQNLQAAQKTYNEKKAVLDSIKAQVESKQQQLEAIINTSSAAGMKGVPPTRAQDPDGTEGITGWNYSMAGKLLGKLIGFIFSFDPRDIADAVSNADVKLVHFGGKEREFNFQLDEGHMVLDGTVTVPRGRSLKLRSSGTITIRGDLWLQRGSTLYAECTRLNLETPPGKSGSSSFWTPCGRIFMEEGASLVCSGDVDVPGSPRWGSVVVGGVPGKIHPINTAIFGKTVKLTNGVFSGSCLDDLVAEAGKSISALATLNDKLLRPLMTQIAPNAAKIVGPFWARKPYFARYATTFQVICPPLPPFGEPGPPIPTPIPLPRKNALIPVARILGLVYSTTLNLSLGENFYTHCDWWIFGEGVVPMVPQVDPNIAKDAISSFPGAALDALDPSTIIKNVVESTIKSIAQYAVTEVIKKIIKEIATSAIPYAGIVSAIADAIADVIPGINSKEDAVRSAGDSMVSSLTDAVKDAGKNTLDNLQSKFTMDDQDLFMREYNGLLVYGENVQVGGNSASGMFVAEQNVDITSVRCIGTVLSHNGNINCASLMFYPYFNRASLYLPRATPEDWLGRALEFAYDNDYNSSEAVDVGPPSVPKRVSAEGWSR